MRSTLGQMCGITKTAHAGVRGAGGGSLARRDPPAPELSGFSGAGLARDGVSAGRQATPPWPSV